MKTNEIVQMITGLAVIAGLALVVWELQQTRDAVKSQLTSEGMGTITQLNTSLFGENPSTVLAKACDHPTNLTTSDLVILDHYYTQLVHRTLRVQLVDSRGGYYGSDDYLFVPRTMRDGIGGWGLMFSTAAGRAYWRTFDGDPALKRYGDEQLDKWQGPNCQEHNAEWLQAIENELQEGGS